MLTAIVAAHAGERTLAIDANRQPAIVHRLLQGQLTPGLTEAGSP
jgi:Mrp family chromosome partitioning ATPase